MYNPRRHQAPRPRQKPRKARVMSVQSPVGGWNLRDSVDSLPKEDAYILDNLFPDLGSCNLRKGYTSYATGMTGDVETLIEWLAGSHQFHIACANNKVWDITGGGVASDITGGATITTDRWQWAQFDDAGGGVRVGIVNGSDTPLIITESSGSPSVSTMTVSGSGLTTSNLIGVNIFKNRSYFWEANSQDFWYSATNALGGVLTKFPLGRVSGFGGNLVAMGTWTIDGGDGVNDLAAFIMSTGDVIIYQGDDPSTTWKLSGIFRIGEPLSLRGIKKFGPDLLVMTRDGYIPLSQNLSKARATTESISDKINPEVARLAKLYSANYGWEFIHYPNGTRILFNIPISATEVHQHVVNTKTGAWSRFKGMNAKTWGIYDNDLYFGGVGGIVYKADVGYLDNTAPIAAEAMTAWNYFGSREQLKEWTASQVIMKTDGSGVSYGTNLQTDFNVGSQPIIYGSVSSVSTPWGSPWYSNWSTPVNIVSDWRSETAMGFNAALRFIVVTTGQEISWLSTNYMFKPGGLI